MKLNRKLKAIMLTALCTGIGVVIAACYGAMDMTPVDDDDSASADDDDAAPGDDDDSSQ